MNMLSVSVCLPQMLLQGMHLLLAITQPPCYWLYGTGQVDRFNGLECTMCTFIENTHWQCRKWLNTSHNATNHHIPSPFRGLTHSNLSDVCCLGFFAISSGLEPCSDCGRLPGIMTGLCPSLAVSCFYDHFCFHLLSSCQLSVLHYFIPAACILSLPWLCMVLVMTTHHHSPVLLWMTLTYLPEEWG